jgi:hypothetical protein
MGAVVQAAPGNAESSNASGIIPIWLPTIRLTPQVSFASLPAGCFAPFSVINVRAFILTANTDGPALLHHEF